MTLLGQVHMVPAILQMSLAQEMRIPLSFCAPIEHQPDNVDTQRQREDHADGGKRGCFNGWVVEAITHREELVERLNQRVGQ
jgi:hypothetical protein